MPPVTIDETCPLCGIHIINTKALLFHLRKEHQIQTLEQYVRQYHPEMGGNCKVCGKPTRFKGWKKGFSTYCSIKCRDLNPEVREKLVKTNQERYGGNAPICSPEVLAKRNATNQERYGGNSPACDSEVTKKRNKTNQERYGHTCSLCNPEVREKARQTNLERYGVDSPVKAKEIQEKMQQTNLERYGVKFATQSNEIKEKRQQTNLERYGGKAPYSSIEIREKGMATNIERYGNPFGPTSQSKGEIELGDYIESIYSGKIIRNDWKQLSGKEIDIYLPELNIGFEYQGDYWHTREGSKEHDEAKRLLAESVGITIIPIWEHDWIKEKDTTKSLVKNIIHQFCPE